MIQNYHWREAARTVLKSSAREQRRSVSAILRQADIDRLSIEWHEGGLSFATLAKLDGQGVSWKRIAFEAERLSLLNQGDDR